MAKKTTSKNLTIEQKKRKLIDLKKELYNLRFKKINNQVENYSKFKLIKREVARLNTITKEQKWLKKF